ncbi:archaemetzincin-2-like [Amphiura filiformis]|uniref:archaemetzincin-2-like n=1 Tax=Amphiura filiformis TaxID=82378 RepID=UPI003B2213A4
MFSCCVTSPEKLAERKAKYLLGNVDKLDEDLQQWLQKEASQCQLIEHHKKKKNGAIKDNDTTNQSDALDIALSPDQENTRDSSTPDVQNTLEIAPDNAHLFSPISSAPVGMRDRQTYRMWKAMIELSESFICKTHITDIPKTLHFFPLETYDIPTLDDFDINGMNFLQFLVKFLEVFFPGLTVIHEDLFDINIHMNDVITSRFHKVTGKKQFLVRDLYCNLHKSTKVPYRHYILGLTWTDLYPKEELNFVLGEASSGSKCAVLGFGRYEPMTFKEGDEVELMMDGALLWQLLRVASHETTHLFGIKHCMFFSCAMNESKSVKAALDQPLFLCPVCLRKLQKFLGFDIRKRYSDLLELCTAVQNSYPSPQLNQSVEWLKRCVTSLSDPAHR